MNLKSLDYNKFKNSKLNRIWKRNENNYANLEVPVYIIHGKHDLNAPVNLVEDYYEQLQAPEKKLLIFENSGHSPWINENQLFCEKTNELFIQHKK
jgi:pimeloyl-ACP methyl ester carboxylesterase